jgi:hypothetical protein
MTGMVSAWFSISMSVRCATELKMLNTYGMSGLTVAKQVIVMIALIVVGESLRNMSLKDAVITKTVLILYTVGVAEL